MENNTHNLDKGKSLFECKTCHNQIHSSQFKKNTEFEKLNIESLDLSINHGVLKSIHEHYRATEENLHDEIKNLVNENNEIVEENNKLFYEYNKLRYKLQKIRYYLNKKKGRNVEEVAQHNTQRLENDLENFLFNYQTFNMRKQRNDTHPYTVYPNFCPHFRFNYITIYSCCNKAYPCEKCHNKKEYHFPENNGLKYYCTDCFNITDLKRCETCKVEFFRKNINKKNNKKE